VVIDPSVIIAILYGEPEETIFLSLVNSSQNCFLSAPGYVETFIVLVARYGEEGVENLNNFF
jgi:ribonuclease VapC